MPHLAEFHNYLVRKHYASQLVCILAYLRERRVVHRDLKPANLLLNERWQLVLADFGTSKILNDFEVGVRCTLKKSVSTNQLSTKNLIEDQVEEEEELVGTEEYISPEAIETTNKVTFAADLWSFGVILCQIFSKTNSTPFADVSQEKTF